MVCITAFIATKYGMGGEGKDKLINTLVYLTNDIDFSSVSLKSDLGSAALVSVCSELLFDLK